MMSKSWVSCQKSPARQARVGLALGTCFIEPDDLCYNQVRFYTPCGDYLGFHSKQLRCGSMSGPAEGEITHYAAAPLGTFDFGGITIAGLICNDMWANPQCTPMPDSHLSQQLSEMGAKVIFHAVNGGRGDDDWSHSVVRPYHRSNLQMRARAGELWIVTVDNAAPEHIATASPGGVVAPDGAWACETPDRGTQMFAWTIEVE
jgi:predicted amidohydrolase